MQESTAPIWIPAWDEYPEIVPILDMYERAHESVASTKTLSIGPAAQKLNQAAIVNRVKSEFLQGTLDSFLVSGLVDRLNVWVTEDATSVSLSPEELVRLWQYVRRVPSKATGCKLALSEEEHAFCEMHGLFAYVPIAEELIKRHFPDVVSVFTELMKDPEAEGEWLVISAKVDGEIEAVLDAYDHLTRDWIAAVPWPKRERIVIDYSIM